MLPSMGGLFPSIEVHDISMGLDKLPLLKAGFINVSSMECYDKTSREE